jgi:hypothetical protein
VAILFSSLLTPLCPVSASATTTYRLSAQKGDWASYKVDQFDASGINLFARLKEGLIVRFEVTDVATVTLFDESNATALAYERPAVAISVNGSAVSYLGELQVDVVDSPFLCGLTPPPFYPCGAGFWREISKYNPMIEVSYQTPTIRVVEGVFVHYISISQDQRYEVWEDRYVEVEIDEQTGVMKRYENALLSGNVIYYILVMSLVDSSVLLTVSTLAQSAVFSASLLVPIILVGAILFASTRNRSAAKPRKRGHRK